MPSSGFGFHLLKSYPNGRRKREHKEPGRIDQAAVFSSSKRTAAARLPQYIKDDADRRSQGCRASDADLADPVGAVVNVVELFGPMRAEVAQADHARIATQGTELCSGFSAESRPGAR
jgi:hypothetical protein